MPAAMLRRVLRHLFTPCAAASLVLCVAVCAMWVRGQWVGDRVEWYTENNQPNHAEWRDLWLDSEAGAFSFSWRHMVARGDPISPTEQNVPRGITYERNENPAYPRHIDGPPFDFD